MTIDTQSAAPQGAAPASIVGAANGPGPGAPAGTGDAFATLVAQMTKTAPAASHAGRSDRAAVAAASKNRASTRASATSAEPPARCTRNGEPASASDATVASGAGDAPPADSAIPSAPQDSVPSGVAVPVCLFQIAEQLASANATTSSIDHNSAQAKSGTAGASATASQQQTTPAALGAALQGEALGATQGAIADVPDGPDSTAHAPHSDPQALVSKALALSTPVQPPMNMRGAMTASLERGGMPGPALQSAVRSGPGDVPTAERAGSDRLNATGRAPGGTLAADHMATDVAGRVAAFNPGTAANDQSGTNAGREFNDRATAPASARESRASGPSAVGELAARIDGAAAVRTDEVLAAGAIADRATAAHGVSLAIAGVTPAAAVTDAAAVSATDTSDSTIPDESDLRRQLVQAIKFQWRDGAGDVKLTLQPGYLGDVAISLRVEQNGGVTAHVQADASDVRSWISANEPLLRQGLTEQGLTLDRLVVAQEKEEATSDHEGRKRQPQQETPEQLPKRRETAIFEVIV